jgi:cysteine synthase B
MFIEQPINSQLMANQNVIWSRVGQTPLLPMRSLLPGLPPGFDLYGKAEWHNPAGSVKDRPAARIIQGVLEAGYFEAGKTFLDSTSGNMGIAYATLGAAIGLPVHLVIPANAGPERMGRLKALGAQLTLSDPLEGSDGAHAIAAGMMGADPERYFFADQYNNDANWLAHYETTGPEIWAQTKGGITHLVCGLGTTGTITGTGRFLKEKDPGIQLIAVQPDSPLHGLEGLKHLASSPIPGIFDVDLLDQTIEVSTEDTYQMLRTLARDHGLLLGISSGAALVAARALAKAVDTAQVVVILPDSGSKYLSQPFWTGS